MRMEPMRGPVALAIFWLWLGFIAAGALAYLAYRLLRARAPNAKRSPPSRPVKYAKQLRRRLQKQPSRPGTEPPDDAGNTPQAPSRKR